MMKVEFNLPKLAESAKSRWFKTQEVYQMLKGLKESNLNSMILDKLPERPHIGSFFLISAEKSNKKWKQDGYAYVKRNNGVGFREDVVYLKIAGAKEVMCSYSYLDNSLLDSINLPTCRRIYKLINSTGNQNFYLVHYLNEKVCNESSADKTPEICAIDVPNSIFSTSDEVSKSESKQFEEETDFTSPNLADYLEKATDSDLYENREDKALNFISYFELNESEFAPTNFFTELENKFSEIPSFSTSLIPSTNPPKDIGTTNFTSLQNKFSEIENRLISLENEKPNPILQNIPTFPNYEKDNVFNIVDYSPEWDFTKGGAKVIICVSPLCFVAEAINEKLKVYFGEISVPGYFIQPGVLKCYAPPHSEGFVKLTLRINNEIVSMNQGPTLFEYRKERRHRTAQRAGAVQSDLGMTGEFKVRVVQKMREYDNLFGAPSQAGRDVENEQLFRKYSEMKQEVSNSSFLPEADLLKIIQFMSINYPKGRETEFQAYLDKIDRYGFALIHYLCYLQYNSCLEFILKCGASPNTKSANSVSPLEISLKYKNEIMLELLLSKGALGPKKVEEALRRNYLDTPQNELDIASLYKDRNLLDMLLREVSLCDSINNSLSAAYAESDDRSDDGSYMSLQDFLEDKFDNFGPIDFKFRKRRGCEQSDYGRKDEENNQGGGNLKGGQTKRPRKYFRNYDKKTAPQKENLDTNSKTNIDTSIAVEHQNEIKIIQKNVRGWLLRRQYLDILHATRVLQNYMRGKTQKKKANEDEEAWDEIFEDKLKNKVKDLLHIIEK